MKTLEQDTRQEVIKDKHVRERLDDYSSRHDLIGEEIFPYIGLDGLVDHLADRYSYRPVIYELEEAFNYDYINRQ